jgi:hypothetical protein
MKLRIKRLFPFQLFLFSTISMNDKKITAVLVEEGGAVKGVYQIFN